jgi:hypothetical protein
MPKFKNAPKLMNTRMHHVYAAGLNRGLTKKSAAKIAIFAAKKSFKKKGGIWVGKK